MSSEWLKELPPDGYSVYSKTASSVVMSYNDLVNFNNLILYSTFWDNAVWFFTNPSDYISSIIFYPFNVKSPDIDVEGYTYYLQIGDANSGNINDETKRVKCHNVIGNQNQKIEDLGSCKIERYFNNFLDYNGFTKISIYLPFYGYRDIETNDVMDRYVYVKLYVDLLSGNAQYYIGVNENNNADLADIRIIDKINFSIGYKIPLGSSNAAEIARNVAIGVVKTIGGVTSALALGGGSSISTMNKSYTDTMTKNSVRKSLRGRGEDKHYEITSKGNATKTETKNVTSTTVTNHSAATGYVVSGGVVSAADVINNMWLRTSVGDISNNPCIESAATRCPHIIIKRPIISDALNEEQYAHIYGKPLCQIKTLSDLSGFTKCSGMIIDNLPTATPTEVEMICSCLQNGVIL